MRLVGGLKRWNGKGNQCIGGLKPTGVRLGVGSGK